MTIEEVGKIDRKPEYMVNITKRKSLQEAY